MASSMHGDAFLAWDDDALGHRVKNCVVQRAKCNTAGDFCAVRRQFGTPGVSPGVAVLAHSCCGQR